MTEAMIKCGETFKRVEITDYFWGSKTFNFPWYVLKKLEYFPPVDQYDFENPFLSYIKMSVDHYCQELNSKLNSIEVAFKFRQTGQSSISEPVTYDGLTLYPDGTLKCSRVNSSYDRDGPYNWDSRFSYSGTWAYDASSRLMKLTLEKFGINNNGVVLSDTEIAGMNILTQVETKNFYFEGDYIRCLDASWDWAKCTGVLIREFKKK